MSEPAPSLNLVVRGLLIRDGQLLVSRWQGGYAFPMGGRLEPGETLEQGVRREFLEETGIVPRIRQWVYFHEGFYRHERSGLVHELGWYFWVEAETLIGSPGASLPHPDSERLRLEYADVHFLKEQTILPRFLAEYLPRDLEAGFASNPRHLISRETDPGVEITEEVPLTALGASRPR